MEKANLNLVQKLASIRRELRSIEKKGHNSFQKYDYLRAEDIAGEMGDRLAAMNVIVARRNLSFVQDNITVVKDGNERTDVHVIVTLDYVFIDGDSGPGPQADVLSISSIGEGRDSGDKAVAKAMTNALKYALTQPLMMRVGDDPEADAPHDTPETRKTPQNGSKAPHGASGEDATILKTTRISLIKKVKAKLGDEVGMKWLSTAAKEMRKKSETLTLADMLELSERVSKLTPPEEIIPEEETDIEF